MIPATWLLLAAVAAYAAGRMAEKASQAAATMRERRRSAELYTITVEVDTAQAEAALERLQESAKRFLNGIDADARVIEEHGL